MQSTSSLKKSTETLYEIKAPLASFDTIDLDDDEQYYLDSRNQVIAAEKGLKETAESSQSNSPVNISENSIEKELETPTIEQEEVATPSEAAEDFNDNFAPAEVKETENSTASAESKEANSSENNASAEEIQNQLKVKGRKYREKASNVKYEQIENTSDVSDQEKTENFSPLPTLKLKPSNKTYESDSESSDSDSGYIRRGYLSANKGATSKHDEQDGSARHFVRAVNRGKDTYDSDSTPHSSPKVSRPVLPPPLSKEESAIASKRKAYEKRLQRLQVTTAPIERPRSTTPIDIHGLEEYASISSPEKSPGGSNLEKLKIRLPREDSFKGKSPRRSAKSVHDPCSSPVFSFNEDLLFSHTRSAILLEEGLPGQSPKRVLVPPTLSPKLSPACSPQARKLSSHSPRYVFYPETARNGTSIESEPKSDSASSTIAAENWATFDDIPVEADMEKAENDLKETKNYGDAVETEKEILDINGEGNTVKQPDSPVKKHVPQAFDVHKCEELNKDEILTVQIEESGDTRMCDIKYEVDLK